MLGMYDHASSSPGSSWELLEALRNYSLYLPEQEAYKAGIKDVQGMFLMSIVAAQDLVSFELMESKFSTFRMI